MILITQLSLNYHSTFPNRTHKYNEQKKINQDLESKIEYLNRSKQDLENKIKVIKAKEKQLKLISALPNDIEDKQYFKNKIDYLIQEIDYCIDRISI